MERRLQKETVVAVILHTGLIPHLAGGELVSEDLPQTQAVEIGITGPRQGGQILVDIIYHPSSYCISS